MNLPNKLTVIRILLVPVLIVFLLVKIIPYRFLFAFIVFLIASFTDHLDGKIARKNGQITDFGKFLDPLADKMLVMSVFISFIELNLVSAVPVIIILMREFIVTSIRLTAMGSGKVIAANIWGKIKTVSQIISISIVLLSQCFFQISGIVENSIITLISIINNLAVWISVVFTVISGIIYIMNNMDFIKNAK